MTSTRLVDRFLERLRERGSDTPRDRAAFAADFARLLLAGAPTDPASVGRATEATVAATVRRCGIPTAEARLLVDLAQAPEFRPVTDQLEIEAFTARFGAAAGALLRAQEGEELDLGAYANRYGSGEALLLLDAMFQVAANEGAIQGPELRQLEASAAELGIDAVLFAALHRKHDPRHARGELEFPVSGARVRIGRSPGNDVVLPDPQVAPHHCDLVRAGEGWRVVDADSGRPTVLGGRPVASAPISPTDELRIGPYTLRLGAGEDVIRAWGQRSFAALSARNLTRKIGEVSLLEDVSFTVFSGEVIALVGPSGAGKTTLLNAIAGVTPADSGEVLLDGEDFHAILEVDRSRVGTVPQDDIVHPELTVEESLYYSARLRFAPDTSEAELRGEVDRVLAELGIEHIRHSRIGDAMRRGISGGQRKRVNLGQELLTRSTRVLFLDEPTSGLDPRAAQDIVRLVRQLADRGRIVFLVTHDLSPQVMAQVDHLLVLAAGGRLAYFGPPADACRYFSVPTADAIFNRFQDRPPSEWGAAYRASPDFRKFVRTREDLLQLEGRPRDSAPPPRAARPSRRHQFVTLARRYLRVKLRDRTGLWVLGAQPPFLALVMALVFPKATSSMLFMLTLSCLWFGMSAAVRELISDRVVWVRERRVGVRVLPYVGSKIAVLGGFAVLQCTFLASLAWAWFGLGGYGFDLDTLAAVASLAGVVGMALGLLVSALFTSSEAAVGTLPLLLIPQISFSTFLLSFNNMPVAARGLTWVDPLRYAYDAMLKVAAWRNDFGAWEFGRLAVQPRPGSQWGDPLPVSGPLYEFGLKGSGVDDIGLPLGTLVLALLGFTTLFLAGSVLRVMTRRDG